MKYRCPTCGYIYDEEETGVKFADLPDDWECPICGEPKSEFVAIIVYVIAGSIFGDPIDWYSYVFAAIDAIILVYLLVSKDPFRQLGKDSKEAEFA